MSYNNNLTSDYFDSENTTNRKEGIKFIAQSVYGALKQRKECTYQEVVDSVCTKNNETKVRRVYDVLNVLRAINVVEKRDKTFTLVDTKDDLRRKRQERDKLKKMKEAFLFITERNQKMQNNSIHQNDIQTCSVNKQHLKNKTVHNNVSHSGHNNVKHSGHNNVSHTGHNNVSHTGHNNVKHSGQNETLQPGSDDGDEKLKLPFMVIYTDKESEIHCVTNEEKNYFNFKGNRTLNVMEDLEVIGQIMKSNKNSD